MRRAAIAAVGGCVLGLALLLSRGDAWAAWLAAWVAWMALPLGALPLVAGAALAGVAETPFITALRRLLWLLPAGAVLSVPLLLSLPARHAIGLAALLAVWSVFAAVLARPVGAVLGGAVLVLHAPLLTVAAAAAMLALDPGFASASFGLLLISAQAGAAAAAALIVAEPGETTAARVVALLLAAWAFLHFTQYLIVWSADLPAEIVWYQRRAAGLGAALIWVEAAAALVGGVLLSAGEASRRRFVAIGAGLLALHVLEMLWLVTPSYRGRFVIDIADLTALAGGICLAAALLRTVSAWSEERDVHAAV